MTTPETRELSAAKAFARATVHGLWIAIPTPFSADGRLVDEEVLEAAVERYVETLQVDGIFCGGVMGEFGSLTIDERRHVHEVVVRQVTGRVPVVAHVGHHAFAETVALCGHAADHGIPLGIVMNPFYPRTRPTRSCARGTARWTGRPTCRCSCSTRMYSGYTLSPELIAELAELDVVCGIKNPQGKAHLLRLQELVGDRIIVTDAAEPDWLDLHVNHGFRSLMSTPALALYQRAGELPIVEYTRRADAGDLEGARALSDSLEPARALV